MSFGLAAFTLFHVALSLIAIVTGLAWVLELLRQKLPNRWTTVFLATTALTSITGFFFPFHQLLPSHILGAISLVVLAIAYFALYGRELAGSWRISFVAASVVALYLNVFVLVVQLFRRVPALRALAPTQTEGPFKVTQLTVLILFIVVGILAATRSRNQLRTA